MGWYLAVGWALFAAVLVPGSVYRRGYEFCKGLCSRVPRLRGSDWFRSVFSHVAFAGLVLCTYLIVFGGTVPPGPEPGPDPPDPDPPTPTPVVEGERRVVIIRESSDDSVEFGLMSVALRNGQHADYLSQNGHELLILDDDSTDGTSDSHPLLSELLPLHSDLPAIFILEKRDGRPLHYQTLTTTDAAEVIALIQEHGG